MKGTSVWSTGDGGGGKGGCSRYSAAGLGVRPEGWIWWNRRNEDWQLVYLVPRLETVIF